MSRVRIPADVDRQDKLLAGLTGRQLAILVLPAMGLWAAYLAIRGLLPPAVFGALAFPWAVAALVLALGRQDGLPADKLALAALRQRRAPRRLTPAPGPTVQLHSEGKGEPAIGTLELPVKGIDADGVVDLGKQGAAVICSASAINLGLRNPDEQDALVEAFGRFLNSLGAPVQILIRSERTDLTRRVQNLRRQAAALPHPGLWAAAGEHAGYLQELASRREVLSRRVLVVFRQPRSADAAATLRRRVDDARTALSAAGITLVALSGDETRTVLARALDPHLPAGTEQVPAVETDGIVRSGDRP